MLEFFSNIRIWISNITNSFSTIQTFLLLFKYKYLYSRLQTGHIMVMVMSVRSSIGRGLRPDLRPSVTHGFPHFSPTCFDIPGMFRLGKFSRKWRLEVVLNFHWVLFPRFQGISMKTYSRVYISLCLFLAIFGRSRTQRKLNPRESFPI